MSNKAIVIPKNCDCGCQVDLTDAENPSVMFCPVHACAYEMSGVLQSIRIPDDVNASAATAIKNVLQRARVNTTPFVKPEPTPEVQTITPADVGTIKPQ